MTVATHQALIDLCLQRAEDYVDRVAALTDEDFWDYVREHEDQVTAAAKENWGDRWATCGCIMEIRSGRKGRLFTEWSCMKTPPPMGPGEHYCRSLGTNLKVAYARVRASAGRVTNVEICTETLREWRDLKTIDFGKHAGTRFEDLPDDYVLWLYKKLKDSERSYDPKARAFAASHKMTMKAIRKRAKALEEAANKKAEEAGRVVKDGKYEVTGEVISEKKKTGTYGPVTKWVIELANGTRVYVTKPASAPEKNCKGRTVTLTATWKQSTKDISFGFGSRPSKLSID